MQGQRHNASSSACKKRWGGQRDQSLELLGHACTMSQVRCIRLRLIRRLQLH